VWHRLCIFGFSPNIFDVAAKYKFFSATTKRWALPVAIILLPGGFVVMAIAWACKLFGSPNPATRPANASGEAGVARPESAAERWRNYLTASRHPALHGQPVPLPARTRTITTPGDEAAESEPARV
jgi:hypothetical protein